MDLINHFSVVFSENSGKHSDSLKKNSKFVQITAEIKTLKPWKGRQILFFMHVIPITLHSLCSSLQYGCYTNKIHYKSVKINFQQSYNLNRWRKNYDIYWFNTAFGNLGSTGYI